jgi:hypothetical protein
MTKFSVMVRVACLGTFFGLYFLVDSEIWIGVLCLVLGVIAFRIVYQKWKDEVG